MSIEYPEIIGKRLGEVDPDLLAETLEHLTSRNMSPAGYVLKEDQIGLITERLLNARIRRRCGCGQDDCRTYDFKPPQKDYDVGLHTVRFYVRGEALLHIDSEGDVYALERLYDLGRSGPVTVYAKADDGTWVSKTLN